MKIWNLIQGRYLIQVSHQVSYKKLIKLVFVPDHDIDHLDIGMDQESSPQKVIIEAIDDMSQGFAPVSQMSQGLILDKEIVKSALKDLKDNYVMIEREIEETTKKQREQQHNRYHNVMERLESLKQSLKGEINNRKETEE